MRPGPGHHLERLIAASPGQQPAAAGHLVGQLVDRGVRDALSVDRQPQVRQRIEPWVSQPCWLTSMSGPKARSSGGTTASKARSHPVSPVPAGSATLTAEPSAPGPPVSDAQPVPGHSVAGCSCRLMVSTRGSS